MSFQFRHKDIIQDSVKFLEQVQIQEVSCPPFVHQRCNPIIEGYQVGQAQFALGEATTAVPSNLLVIHVPSHGFKQDLLHYLARHRGETDWPVVPRVFLFPILKKGVILPLLQSVGTSPDRHDLSNMMESGRAN